MKKNFLFFASNLMYFKSLLPYIFLFIEKKQNVFVRVSSNNFIPKFFFNYYKISRPQSVDLITEDSILHLAKIYKLDKKYEIYKKKINFVKIHLNRVQINFNKNLDKFEKIITTTKDLNYLRIFNSKSKVYAVGYPPIPVFLDLNRNKKSAINLFDPVQKFSKEHNLKNILKKNFYNLSSFSYISKTYKKNVERNTAIIYHPGGYRNVFTKHNETKINCYKIQEKIFKELCEPLINLKIKPLIKIHPWHAKFHGEKDVIQILRNLNLNNKVEVIGANNPYDSCLEKAKFAIMFGSTSAYELWCMGYKNIFFINYYGKARVKKFSFFKKNFFNNKKAFEKAIKSKNINLYFCKDYLKIFNFFRNLRNTLKKDYKYILNN